MLINLEAGSLYLGGDNNLSRVIAADKLEVLYEVQFSEGKWSFSSNPKKLCYYYRTSPSAFLSTRKFSTHGQFSEEERSILRPELPLRLSRCKEIQWSMQQFATLDLFAKKNEEFESSSEIVLVADKVYLSGFLPSNRVDIPILINSSSKNGFTELELRWHANNIQAPLMKKPSSDGIGIYRLGHFKGVPMYYIGGFIDAAGLLNKE